jgi:predicted O-methyltransferase YrrM
MPLKMARLREHPLDELTLRYLRRRVSHLTPRYVLKLAQVLVFEARHPDAPWLTQQAVTMLTTMLRPSDVGLEYGSGRSTRWLARRTGRMTSVETDKRWHAEVQAQLSAAGLMDRVEYLWVPANELNESDPHRSAYLAVAGNLPRQSLDYVLVDGMYRDECAVRAVTLLKPGGLLIIDNINWFVPNLSRSPLSVRSVASPTWGRFLDLVRSWRVIWTSSGVTDTALWIRAD